MSVIGCPFWNTRNKVGAASLQASDWGCTGKMAKEVAEDKRSGKNRLISSLCELDVLRILCQQKKHSFEEESWRFERAYGVLQRSDKAGRSHLLPLELLFQTMGAAAFSIAGHILRVSPAPTLTLGDAFARPVLIMIHTSTASRTSPSAARCKRNGARFGSELRPEFQATIRNSRFALTK